MPSNGLTWALSMMGLDLVEFLALVEIVFSDFRSGWASAGGGIVVLYFYIATASLLLQLVGVLLVTVGWYRLGGIVQIAASTPHIPKGEGLIGIIGGYQAYQYPVRVVAAQAAAEGKAE